MATAAGAILPVNLMAGAGAAFSVVIPSRWAFEVIGHDLGARRILAAFAVVFLVGTWAAVVRTTRRSAR